MPPPPKNVDYGKMLLRKYLATKGDKSGPFKRPTEAVGKRIVKRLRKKVRRRRAA